MQSLNSSSSPQAAQGGWPLGIWLAVLSMSFATFAIVSAEFLPAGLLTPMAADLGISEGLAGQAVTATAVVGAIAALFANILIGRLDRKLVLIGLSMLTVAANLLAAYATDFTMLLIARAALGVALSGFWSLSSAVVARLVGIGAMGRGMSIIFVGVSLATIAAPSVGALVSDFYGWRTAMFLAAGAAAIATVLQVFALPRLPTAAGNNLMGILRLTTRRGVQLGLLAVLLVAGGHFAGFVYVRAFLEQVTQMSAAGVAMTLLAFGVANFFGNLVGGAIADRNQRMGLATVGILMGLSALGLAFFGAELIPAAGLATIWGFAFGAGPIVLQTGVARAAPDDLEGAGSLIVVLFQVSIATGAVVGGLLVDNMGVAYAIGFTGIMALGAVALSTAPRPQVVPAE
ncbi:ABC transporter permease [Devosia geojensis]|uniref:ABC transporter permease n=1 Tax=Devosia geojensis TaxID=443610 RepID=A0A0F5FV35_9HYPH|nr:MFS transporter [Devosia geojensis]KKB12741.1 ABC transporter permease [Devosia geojensis]